MAQMKDRIAADKIEKTLKNLKEESTEKEEKLLEVISSIYDAVKEKHHEAINAVKESASIVNDSVHRTPWRYIGGALMSGIVLGCLLNRSK